MNLPKMDSRTDLIRRWWDEYLRVLRDGRNALGCLDRLNELTAECETAGIVKLGRPMPRDGAHDLADQCDELRKGVR